MDLWRVCERVFLSLPDLIPIGRRGMRHQREGAVQPSLHEREKGRRMRLGRANGDAVSRSKRTCAPVLQEFRIVWQQKKNFLSSKGEEETTTLATESIPLIAGVLSKNPSASRI